MNCKRCAKLASRALDDRLSGPERELLDSHLVACPGCAATYAALQVNRASLAQLASPAVPDALADTLAAGAMSAELQTSVDLMSRFARVAFPVAALTFAVAILFFATTRSHRVRPTETVAPDIVSATLTDASNTAITEGSWFDADDG